MQEANEMKVKGKIVGKTKNRIRNQQTRESCGIQPVNDWMERREWDEHVTRMDAVRLVKISWDLPEDDLQDVQKEDRDT